MEQNFELETILTFTTGINCTDDFDKAFELAWFVYNDKFINTMGLQVIKGELKDHLLGLHPQLNGITYNSQLESSFSAWLLAQKLEYGETLPVCQIGQTLSDNKEKKSKK